MKRLDYSRNGLILLILHLSLLCSSQKSSMDISLGGAFSSKDIMFSKERDFNAVEPWLGAAVPINIAFSYSYAYHDNWSISVGADYRNITMKYTDSEFRDFNGFINDYKLERSVRNYIIPNVMLAYFTDPSKKMSFRFACGMTVDLPFNSYDEVTIYTGEEDVYSRFSGSGNGGFKEGILFGPRLEAGVVFNPWYRKRNGRIAFTANVLGDMLFYGESDSNPKFVIGLNLGIRYLL